MQEQPERVNKDESAESLEKVKQTMHDLGQAIELGLSNGRLDILLPDYELKQMASLLNLDFGIQNKIEANHEIGKSFSFEQDRFFYEGMLTALNDSRITLGRAVGADKMATSPAAMALYTTLASLSGKLASGLLKIRKGEQLEIRDDDTAIDRPVDQERLDGVIQMRETHIENFGDGDYVEDLERYFFRDKPASFYEGLLAGLNETMNASSALGLLDILAEEYGIKDREEKEYDGDEYDDDEYDDEEDEEGDWDESQYEEGDGDDAGNQLARAVRADRSPGAIEAAQACSTYAYMTTLLSIIVEENRNHPEE